MKEDIDPYVQQAIAGTNGLMYRTLINRLKRYPLPFFPLSGSGSLLDIGCNWGRWSIAACEKGYRTIGIDTSSKAISAARRVAEQLHSPAHYLVADAKSLPFSDGSYDVVFSYSVLQHFSKENVYATLKEIARVLKPEGKCLVQMANIFGIHNLLHQLKRGIRAPQAFEVRYWKPSELLEVVSQVFISD